MIKTIPLLALLVVLGFFNPKTTFAQKSENDFQINFNIAKQHLSQRRIQEALPYLNYLHKRFPQNDNLKYLIGLCYAELEIVNPLTIELLETASAKSSLDYNPNNLDETRVPIYVYYYLCLAYSQNKKCQKAEEAREKFIEVYPYDDPYYLKESKRWLGICEGMKEEPEEDSIPDFPDFKPYSSDSIKKELTTNSSSININEDSLNALDKEQRELIYTSPTHVVTKEVDFSTENPLYGVQLGAFKEVVPVSRFKDLKNVDAFMDRDGLIRYVIGNFGIYSQAESLLKVIKEKGYPDAFVVNVNNARKFSDEVISVDNINIRASLKGKVEYRIQLGAFKEEVTTQLAEMYLKVEGIEEWSDQIYTYLTVGNFGTYQEAKAYQQGIRDAGISDAFVIAINNGKKISLKKANDFSGN